MSDTLLSVLIEAVWDFIAATFQANPIAWSCVIAGAAAAGWTAHELLERRGPRATLWGMASASLFALFLAYAPLAGASP